MSGFLLILSLHVKLEKKRKNASKLIVSPKQNSSG